MKKIDSSLKFYRDVLKLERLHYGLWDGEPLCFDGLKKAQKRYEDYLLDIIREFSPGRESSLILDAGCGSGEMVKTLSDDGYSAEGLSPDPYQEEIFREKTGAPFHRTTFEEFRPVKKYSLILMSESAQYIPMEGLFERARNITLPGGHLVVSDYFLKDGAEGPQARSGHLLSEFKEKAREAGLALLREDDLTDRTAPTLDFAAELADMYVLPSARILRDRFARKHPELYGLARFIFRKKIRKLKEDRAIIDSGEFRKNKRYMLLVYRNN